MPKSKITVVYQGAVIGTRTTDRNYQVAVAWVGFDEARFRVAREREFANRRAERARSFEHAAEAVLSTYRHAQVVSDEQRANYAAILKMGPEAYVKACRARHDKYTEEMVERFRKPSVVSYHSTAALATKAIFAFQKHSPWAVLTELPVTR